LRQGSGEGIGYTSKLSILTDSEAISKGQWHAFGHIRSPNG
jgi:hypothetical protein